MRFNNMTVTSKTINFHSRLLRRTCAAFLLFLISGGLLTTNLARGASAGTVVAWGNPGVWGGDRGQATVPAGLSDVVAISAGGLHSLALKADGTVVAWGDNLYGQTNVPSGLTNVLAIAGCFEHNLALVGEGPPVVSIVLSNALLSNSKFSFSLPTHSGRVYALEFKNSLADSNWTALPLVAGNGGVKALTDPSATSAQRFYRVRQW